MRHMSCVWVALGVLVMAGYSQSQTTETIPSLPLTNFEDIANTPGLELDTTHVKTGKASGKWAGMDKTPGIVFENFPRDWTRHNHLEFWLYSEKSLDTAFMIIAASENPKSEGPDYYGYRVPLNFTGWKHFSFYLDPRVGARMPIGFHHITGLRLTASGWDNTPHPEAVVYLNDLKLTHMPKQLGPLTKDDEFFAALDLERAGLEAVRAAAERKDIADAKTQLQAYMRSRKTPVWRFDWRSRPEGVPLPPPPPGAKPSDGADYFSQEITIDWKGWKHFRLPKPGFGVSRKPVGWNYIVSVNFCAAGWNHTPDPRLVLHFDDVKLTGNRTAVIGDFSTERQATRWSGAQRDESVRKVGSASARWEKMHITSAFRTSQIPHDWTDFDALEFWCHANEATGAKLQLVLSSDAKEHSRREPDIMRHVFRTLDAEMYLGERIDWEANPVPRTEPHFTNEWTYGLNRFGFWNQLGDLYWATGDEKYAREWVAQLRSWVEDQPVPYDSGPGRPLCWRTIECGIRMAGSWPNAYYRFLGSPSFDPETHAMFLKSVREHARRLTLVLERDKERSNNWIIMECNGLLHCAVLFPEFREAAEWMRTAVDRLNVELTRQVYPDGAQMELTSGYHQVCLHNFYGASEIASLNKIALPGEYMKNLEMLYHYNLYAMMPNRTLAPLNDAGITNVKSSLAQGAQLFNRPDFLWAGSDGTQGTPPNVTSYAFPYAGHFVMRTGWEKDDKFLIFDGGPYGIAHQHEDKLTFFMWAFGRALVTEPGNYRYDHSKWRRHVLSTEAHNTILVNGMGQRRSALKDTWQTSRSLTEGPNAPCVWFTSDRMDLARSTYDSGYGPKNDKTVSHERTLIFVKPDYWVVVDRLLGKGRHAIQSLYHLDSDNVHTDPATKTVRTLNKDANVAIAPASAAPLDVEVVIGREDPVQGWIPDKRRKIPCVIFKQEAECPMVVAAALFPYQGAEGPPISAEIVKSQDPIHERFVLRISTPAGGTDYVAVSFAGKGETRFDEFTTDAEAAVIRTGPTGVTGVGVMNGTHVARRGEKIYSKQ